MENNKKYFECYGVEPLFKAVLDAMEARYYYDDKSHILKLDAKTAVLLQEVTANNVHAYDIISDCYTKHNGYLWTKEHFETLMSYLRDFAQEIGEDNEISVIFKFNFNNDNRYNGAKGFAPIRSAYQIARALFVEDDENHVEIFETLAEYAVEETAWRLLDGNEITAVEAAIKYANA